MCVTPVYWLGVLLVVILLMVAVVSIHLWQLLFHLTLTDKLRLRASLQRSKSSSKSIIFRSKTSIRREFRTQSIRSGYAFAQEPGFGEFITSGRYIRKSSLTANDVAAVGGASQNNGTQARHSGGASLSVKT